MFGVYGLRNGGMDDSEKQSVVTRGKMEHLAAMFSKKWLRSPTPEELGGLVRDYVREEVMYREAVSMGSRRR